MSISINNFPQIVLDSGLDQDLNLEQGNYELEYRLDDSFVISRPDDNGVCFFQYIVERQEINALYRCPRFGATITIDQSIYNRDWFDENNAHEIGELHAELNAIWQSRQVSTAGGCSFSGRTSEISWLRFFNSIFTRW